MAQTELAKLLDFTMNQNRAPASQPSAPVQEESKIPEGLGQAMVGLLPILAGALVQGARGGAVGGQAGMVGLESLERARKEKEAKAEKASAAEKEAAKESLKTAIELSKEGRVEKRQEREFALSEQRLALEQKKFQAELGSSKKQLESLPIENRSMIEGLSKDSATKTAIANEISQTIALFDDPKVSEQQKIKAGQALLKVLNSTQGSDAVGVEESRRLGSLLEFQVFNLTQPGPMFGRDLPGFRDQAANTVNRLSGAVEANKSLIKQAMTGQSVAIPRVSLKEAEKPVPAPAPTIPGGVPEANAGAMTDRQKRIMELRKQLGK